MENFGLVAPTPEELEIQQSLLGRIGSGLAGAGRGFARGMGNLTKDQRAMAGIGGLAQGLLQAGAVTDRPVNWAEAMSMGMQGFNQGRGQFDASQSQQMQDRLAQLKLMSELQGKAGDTHDTFKIDDLGQAWGRNKATNTFEKIPMGSNDYAQFKTSTYVDPGTGGVTSVLINPRDVIGGAGGKSSGSQPTEGRPGIIEIGGQRTTQANEQAMSFYNRMKNSTSEIDALQKEGFFNPGVWDKTADMAPGSLQAFIQSDEYRRYKAAASDWIKATLRKESGAAIPDSEMDSFFEQYFPQPGESQAVVEQKKRARAIQEQNMMQEAGPALQRRGINEAPATEVRTVDQAKSAGWKLMTDANGNRAYVGPNNQFIEVK